MVVIHGSLNQSYLSTYGDTLVPLEVTSDGKFAQVQQPLSFFLEATSSNLTVGVYLAQASLDDLPPGLRKDVPTPEIVLKVGKGDVYDTSIWLGLAPTYTPLHRDPNPNLFVQLAGTKRVRLFKPDLGNAIFHHVQTSIGGSASASMRGVEMMEGEERTALEEAVWRNGGEEQFWEKEGLECDVGPGDGLFIPKGWWHSIKGIGRGMTGSVNWWFR
ncbi:hypothetical protein MBLNU459_g1384t1 [Dothideomycetes sp. NU459]